MNKSSGLHKEGYGIHIWKFRYCLIALSLICLVTACNDEDCPTCPDRQEPPTPTLANIWPNEDGNAWTYDLTSTMFDVPFNPDPEDPPPMPALEDLYADLQVAINDELLESTSGLFRLAFDGLRTTGSGITAQNMTHTIFTDTRDVPTIGVENLATSMEPTLTADGFELLLQHIAQARPDLRAKIAEQYGVTWEPQDRLDKVGIPSFPLFLHGYAWVKNPAGIFGYGDLDTNLSWIYLEADLSIGQAFQMQLVPVLADDIYLYGRIWSRGAFTAGGLQYENCVECLYAVDFGVREAADENGEVIGMFRDWAYGVIVYAPAVGPVYSRERLLLTPNTLLQYDIRYLKENIVDLVGATHVVLLDKLY